ncbi:hypothetical protein PSOS111911_04655 [Pseudoalteromonas ostreae]
MSLNFKLAAILTRFRLNLSESMDIAALDSSQVLRKIC